MYIRSIFHHLVRFLSGLPLTVKKIDRDDNYLQHSPVIFRLYNIDFQPKWFPFFHVLGQGSFTITEIAQQIGHSHPSVSKIAAEMVQKGLIIEKRDKQDGRRNVLSLSKKGRTLSEKIKDQYADVTAAVEAISKEARHDLWSALEEW